MKKIWTGFLWFWPASLFAVELLHWPLSGVSKYIFPHLLYPMVFSCGCAFCSIWVYLFLARRKIWLPLLTFSLGCFLFFPPVPDIVMAAGFAFYIQPEAAYVKKHCAPVPFVQDEKTYRFGICNLVIASDGTDDFDFIYDTSGDIAKYLRLSRVDQASYVRTIRKYYNDDPNESFEYADFTARRFYKNFYEIEFYYAKSEAFVIEFGVPPKNSKNPYSPKYWPATLPGGTYLP